MKDKKKKVKPKKLSKSKVKNIMSKIKKHLDKEKELSNLINKKG